MQPLYLLNKCKFIRNVVKCVVRLNKRHCVAHCVCIEPLYLFVFLQNFVSIWLNELLNKYMPANTYVCFSMSLMDPFMFSRESERIVSTLLPTLIVQKIPQETFCVSYISHSCVAYAAFNTNNTIFRIKRIRGRSTAWESSNLLLILRNENSQKLGDSAKKSRGTGASAFREGRLFRTAAVMRYYCVNYALA